MVKKSRIALIAAVTALGLTSPAMAQSFYSDFGTGNELQSHFQDNGHLVRGRAASDHMQIAANEGRRKLYDMVNPRRVARQSAWTKSDSADSAALTGGGDAGYNQQLMIDGSEETGS